MFNKIFSLGIIGIGNMGKNHLDVVSKFKNITIKFIYDKKKLRKQPYYVKNFNSLLDKTDIVIIATPTSTHFDIIKKIGKKVKNIFVEKPLVKNFFQTKKIISFAKKNKINIKVGYIERFNPVIQNLHKILKHEKKLFSFEFIRTNAASTRIKDVDIIIDSMVHDIDLAIFFNGKVQYLSAFGSKNNGEIVQVTAILRHFNGVYSTILASKAAQRKIRHVNVIGSKTYYEGNLLTKELYLYKNSVVKNEKNNSFIHQNNRSMIETIPRDALNEELIEFIHSCENKKIKFISDFKESYEVMKICKKIKNEITLNNVNKNYKKLKKINKKNTI
jgi:predicted dehydrogenase